MLVSLCPSISIVYLKSYNIPHEYILAKCTNKGDRQYAMQPDTTPLSLPIDTKYFQSTIGSLLYYARALDGSMLPNLVNCSYTSKSYRKKKTAVQYLLDYANTYPNTYL